LCFRKSKNAEEDRMREEIAGKQSGIWPQFLFSQALGVLPQEAFLGLSLHSSICSKSL
jgi:hypothetical protein